MPQILGIVSSTAKGHHIQHLLVFRGHSVANPSERRSCSMTQTSSLTRGLSHSDNHSCVEVLQAVQNPIYILLHAFVSVCVCTCMYVFVCAHTYASLCMAQCCVEVRGQLAGIISFLLSCGSPGWNLGHQAYGQVPLPLKVFYQPLVYTLKQSLDAYSGPAQFVSIFILHAYIYAQQTLFFFYYILIIPNISISRIDIKPKFLGVNRIEWDEFCS